MKQDCVGLLSSLLFLMTLCGEAYALPQGYFCGPFTLYETKILGQDKNELHNVYQGQDDNYAVEIEAFWNLRSFDDFTDCGTAGCTGTITDIKTKQEQYLHFFCKMTHKGNFKKILCYTNNNEEYLFHPDRAGEYRADICQQYSKFVRLDECNHCFCPIHDSRGDSYSQEMGCTLLTDLNLHCMTGNVYFEKYRPKSKNTDFENCIGLKIK